MVVYYKIVNMDFFGCEIERTSDKEEFPDNVDILTRRYILKTDEVEISRDMKEILPYDMVEYIMTFIPKTTFSIIVYTPSTILKKLETHSYKNMIIEVFKNLSVYKLNEKVSTKILLNTGSGYDGEVTYKVNDRFRYLTPIEKMMIN